MEKPNLYIGMTAKKALESSWVKPRDIIEQQMLMELVSNGFTEMVNIFILKMEF